MVEAVASQVAEVDGEADGNPSDRDLTIGKSSLPRTKSLGCNQPSSVRVPWSAVSQYRLPMWRSRLCLSLGERQEMV